MAGVSHRGGITCATVEGNTRRRDLSSPGALRENAGVLAAESLECPRMSALSRRDFLRSLAAAGAAGFAGGLLPRWARGEGAPRSASLVVRSDYPPQYETPIDLLSRGSWVTENDDFFVRCHLPVPTIDAAAYRLEVSGLVNSPLSLGLADLRAFPESEATCVLECAGNGRALYDLPSTSGTQWEYGAVGNAVWTGVSLKSLLTKAGLQPEARHVWFEAADRGPLKAPPFLRSIPLEKAMDDALLAHPMNHVALPDLHGGPLRAVVPGWYGMAWTKWVTRVRVEATPSDNHFMVKGYRYVYPGEDPALAQPVEEIQVKSLITGFGTNHVSGIAWAGRAGVRKVEISTDGGKTWVLAQLGANEKPFAWRTWSAPLPPDLGTKKVVSRAADRSGRVQPARARPNASGYANNSIVGSPRVTR